MGVNGNIPNADLLPLVCSKMHPQICTLYSARSQLKDLCLFTSNDTLN